MSSNCNAIHLLEQNLDKIHWFNLSYNLNAINIIENNLNRITDWEILSGNPNCIELLIKNYQDHYWEYYSLGGNPNIFEIDYSFLTDRISIFKEKLIQKCFHPSRLIYYLEKYNYDLGEN